MSTNIPNTVGEDGLIAIPADVWRQAGIVEGSPLVVEARDQEIVIRAAAPAIEIYTPERKAEFLLSNAIDEADYQRARAEVVKLGFDPDLVPSS